MRRVGTVVRVVEGILLARSEDETHPEVGEEVVDESLDPVGRVVAVIGPTERPYVVIAPAAEHPDATLLDERVYVR